MLFICLHLLLFSSFFAIVIIRLLFPRFFVVFSLPSPHQSDPHGMCFSSELPRFSDNFTIRISSRGGKDSNGKVQELEATESISKWFDKDGVFYPDQFEPFVRNLLDTWESKAARKEE
eukprot:c5775_g1_i1.p1 GENE.c5775_g1_i1~~c5775_g1_i1.p1  ORF type:complete len:118 (+),score=23.64 c5775_g1_i1:199-552(+)